MVGQRIRSLRLKRNWTLRDLADRCDLSPSFLSLFERGLSSVSIVSLGNICQALGTSLSEFFAHLDENESPFESGSSLVQLQHGGVIVDRDQQVALNVSVEAMSYRLLGRDFPGRQFEIIIGEIFPGSFVSASMHGGEEFGYVLDGKLRLRVAGRAYVLGAGDSFQFDATNPHEYEAIGEDTVRILWVQSTHTQIVQERTTLSPHGRRTANLASLSP